MRRISLPVPDDLHLHVRDDDMLRAIGAASTRTCARAVIMPNLSPPVRSAEQVKAYEGRVRAACGEGFTPLMTLYLTDDTTPDDIAACAALENFVGAKLYPANATTNSAHGVSEVARVDAALAALAEHNKLLLVHGEVTTAGIDIFDREAVFIDEVLAPLLARHPGLKVVFEHITTRAAAEFVEEGPETLAASITAHHLWQNRNAMFEGGLRPHAYCLPVPKREGDRRALVGAATSGHPRFFYGTDSAPHAVGKKESACGCAGVFSAPTALETVVEVFDREGALDHLAAFAAQNGARFYGLPQNADEIELEESAWTIPDTVPAPGGGVRVFRAGEVAQWRVVTAGRTVEGV